ncbi:MAG TPA: penicillin-binding protein 2, partial [Candidatus Paceibacterota bacterium]
MNSNQSFILRIRIILIFICFLALIIIAKLYLVQIIKGDEYAKQGDTQYSRPSIKTLNRGSIFFESKTGDKIGAAIIKDGYSIAINPNNLKDPENVYKILLQYINIDHDTFIKKAMKENDQYEEIQKKVDTLTGESIKSLRIPGIDVIEDNWRIYPGGGLASQTLGLVGYDNTNQLKGQYGLERYYEDVLNRRSSSNNINFFAELFANLKNTVFEDKSHEGNIVSSIDPTVENELENVLKKVKETWGSDNVGGIIMDPKTGEIHAMALLPTFNPNELKDIDDPAVFSNLLVESVYEMGSIMKPLTMAVGIDSGVIDRDSTYNDTGFLMLDSKRISNYDGRARGTIPVQQVLSQSLNVGAATIALKVGNEKFSKYFMSFGLGEKTGIDQPNEQAGIVKNLESPRDIEHATASYGQGIAITPIETIRALSILANEGKIVRPHIVKRIEYSDGSIVNTPIEEKQVIKKETAEDVTKMLVTV